jgi:hypothetical protein
MKYDHKALPPDSNRVRCPVCQAPVYSRAGIHPQCAVRQADPPRPKVKPQAKSLVPPAEAAELPAKPQVE